MLGDEDSVVGKEGGVESVLDAGDVEAAVFGEGVVAVEEEGDESDGEGEKWPGGAGPSGLGC